MVYYSSTKRGGEPVVCLFGAKRLTDGTVSVDILAVAAKVKTPEMMVISPDGKSRLKIRLPEDMLDHPVPLIAKEVRIEQI